MKFPAPTEDYRALLEAMVDAAMERDEPKLKRLQAELAEFKQGAAAWAAEVEAMCSPKP